MPMKPDGEISSGAANTPWLDQVRPAYPRLTGETEADVAIIGGGIAGLSVAYQLTLRGKSVALLEDGLIGSGETGRTTAHLSSALDDRYSRLEKLHGLDGARLAYESHTAAIDEIERIVRKEGLSCEFERLPGFLFCPPGEPPDLLDAEFEATGRIGFKGVRSLMRAPFPTFESGPCLRFPDQGQFHPTKYLAGLAQAIKQGGGRIHERSHVEDFESKDRIWVKVRDGGTLTASALVVATNAPIVSRVKIPLKQFAYRTYAMSFAVRKGSILHALYWDTADPYHYVRTAGDLLIVGGEDHKTGQPEHEDARERYARLEAWTRERFPEAGKVVDRWSGQTMEPADGLAFIGRYKGQGDNIYIATGDSGHGMTHGTIAGLLISDLILGRANPWETLYDPSRKTLRSMGEVMAENLNVVPQYGKWLTPGDGKTSREVGPGEGHVVRRGLKKVAVCRTQDGRLCTMSATCPHLGAVLTWNAAEKTWDCPAHGSRFSPEGRVLNGPANSDLVQIHVPAKKAGRRRRA